ncbi:hypothetical protein V8E36_007663 [Tilletia maclaganii]
MTGEEELTRPSVFQQPSDWTTSTSISKNEGVHRQAYAYGGINDTAPPKGPRFGLIAKTPLTALGMIAALGGPGVALVLYIVDHGWQWAPTAGMLGRFEIVNGTQATQILLFSAIATKIAGWVLAPVMSIFALACAAAFVNDKKKARPTPAQLSMGISVLGGANLMALYNSMGMLLEWTKGARKHTKTTKLSSFVRSSIMLLLWLTFLETLLTGADTALHKTTKATFAAPRRTSISEAAKVPAHSRQINQTYCDNADYDRCGLADYESYDWGRTKPPARRMLSNSSDSRIVLLQDGTAIIVASPAPAYAYEAQSIGLRADCTSLTRSSCSILGEREFTSFDCTNNASPFNASVLPIEGWDRAFGRANYHSYGVLDKDGNALRMMDLLGESPSDNFSSSSFNVGTVSQSWAYIPSEVELSGDRYLNNTGLFYKNTYDPSTRNYTTIEEMEGGPQLTYIFALQADYWIWEAAAAVGGVGYADGLPGEYEAALSRLYARYLLAGVSLPVIATTDGVTIGDTYGQGSIVNVVVLGLYIGTLALLILTVLLVTCVSFVAWCSASSRGYLQATRLLLLGPGPIICQLLGDPVPKALKQSDALDMFAPATEADRLTVAPERHGKNGNWTMQVHRAT